MAVVFCLKRTGEASCWRLGLTATRKVGNAVVRNRVRRRAREFFRRRGGTIPEGWDFVVNLRSAGVEATAEMFNRDLDATMRRLGFETNDN